MLSGTGLVGGVMLRGLTVAGILSMSDWNLLES